MFVTVPTVSQLLATLVLLISQIHVQAVILVTHFLELTRVPILTNVQLLILLLIVQLENVPILPEVSHVFQMSVTVLTVLQFLETLVLLIKQTIVLLVILVTKLMHLTHASILTSVLLLTSLQIVQLDNVQITSEVSRAHRQQQPPLLLQPPQLPQIMLEKQTLELSHPSPEQTQ
jgi:hypothetical protein